MQPNQKMSCNIGRGFTEINLNRWETGICCHSIALGIEDAIVIEFQRVHRMGKPRSGNGNGSRTISPLF